jgi:hypothetical protein
MPKQNCSKCGGEMDEGYVTQIGYVSDRQTGFARVATPIRRVRACLTCGVVEWFLDPEELKRKIQNK